MRMRSGKSLALAVLLLVTAPARAAEIRAETYTLPNGLTVILHEDHQLPQVTINTWFAVGSKDEAPGRTGFAHLFEHLMFMGTARVPGNQFDMLMEAGGGANNASTTTDRTNYFSWGPRPLLPTLLWLDADRLEGLAQAMTQEKLDLQRSVVRNERRQGIENQPYGIAELIVPEALYPADHPYHHPVIGSHEDLEAATVTDVQRFFTSYYTPGNATLVVAGDFEAAEARRLVAETFGAVPLQPLPPRASVAPIRLTSEVRRLASDKVRYPRLYLVWPSPAAYQAGDAELDLLAMALSDGSSGRLFTRLVLEERIAQDVSVRQESQELGSEFRVEVTAAEGADLERIKREVLDELARVARAGLTDGDLTRVKAASEAGLRRRVEGLAARADMLNEYHRFYGEAASFERDLARRLAPTPATVREWAAAVFGPGRLDLRILPDDAQVQGASLERRPPELPSRAYDPPTPTEITLASGIPLQFVPRPGSGLFAGYLLVDGGERLVPPSKAGLATLVATLLTKGAGDRDAAAFAEAAAALGASVEASASWRGLTLSVGGLAGRLDTTLDLFADAVLRPRFSEADVARERDLQVSRIRARSEDPQDVARLAARVLLFGRDDPRGRPGDGWADSVSGLGRPDVSEGHTLLLDPARARFVFVGDCDAAVLRRALDVRFKAWKPGGRPLAPPPDSLTQTTGGRIVLVDRPAAPQTIVMLMRPIPPGGERDEAIRDAIETLFGGSFTSRLMQNIREQHGFSYGAGARLWQEGHQYLLMASSAVQTAVTGAALVELKREFDRLASGDVTPEELEKARRTVRFDLIATASTTDSLARTLAQLAANGRPGDAVARELAALEGITCDDVNAAARSGLFDFSQLLVVLVGDRATVAPQIVAAGFGQPRLADVDGALE